MRVKPVYSSGLLKVPFKRKVLFFVPVTNATGNTELIVVPLNDPDLIATDARVVKYKGLDYLTTISHLRLMKSDDGVHFSETTSPFSLFGENYLDVMALNCRVRQTAHSLCYLAAGSFFRAQNIASLWSFVTRYLHHFRIQRCRLDNKFHQFDEKIKDRVFALHRPRSMEIGGNFIWLAQSGDGKFRDNHQCLIKTRPGMWDSSSVGAGASPIKTDQGWRRFIMAQTGSISIAWALS